MKKSGLLSLFFVMLFSLLVYSCNEPQINPFIQKSNIVGLVVKVDIEAENVKHDYLATDTELDTSNITVTAYFGDGSSEVVTDYTTDFAESCKNVKGLNKAVNVKFTWNNKSVKTKILINRTNYEWHEVPVLSTYRNSNFNQTDYPEVPDVYYEFGDYPQSAKRDAVLVSEDPVIGDNYFIGSDGGLYLKEGDDYFKVEPIYWRVLNTKADSDPENPTNYLTTGKALLWCENILDQSQFYKNNEKDRKYSSYGEEKFEGSNDVYPTNYKYSTVRAFLNNLDGSSYHNDSRYDFSDKGFLTKAFTVSARNRILVTTVHNAAWTTSATNATTIADHAGCPDTEDKVFLLSTNEMVNSDYAFTSNAKSSSDANRKRQCSDYAKSRGVSRNDDKDGYYWTRSPYKGGTMGADVHSRYVNGDGYLDNYHSPNNENVGIVPAMWITLE